MAVSYNKLRKLLIDKNLKKKDLEKKAELSKYTMLCIARNESVNTEALARICKALDCGFDDIMEIKEDRQEMTDKDFEKLKKLSDADEDIKHINELLQDMSAFHKKADSVFEKIDKNLDYKKYIFTLKTAKGMHGNLQFKELPFARKIKVFQMLREAITLYKAEITIKEASNITKSITGETNND